MFHVITKYQTLFGYYLVSIFSPLFIILAKKAISSIQEKKEKKTIFVTNYVYYFLGFEYLGLHQHTGNKENKIAFNMRNVQYMYLIAYTIAGITLGYNYI